MALRLSAEQVAQAVGPAEALAAVEPAWRELAVRRAGQRPRQRLSVPGGLLHLLPASLPARDIYGFKVVVPQPTGPRSWLLLFGESTGELEAVIDAQHIGPLRTAAISALGARFLSRPTASHLGVIGSGRQAWAHVRALCQVLPLQRVSVWSPTPDHRAAFATTVSTELGVDARPVSGARQAAQAADLVVTATPATAPVVRGEWLSPGAHVMAVGAASPQKRELDGEVLRRASRVVVDALEPARQDAGDLLAAVAEGALTWQRVIELGDLLLGRAAGRTLEDEITVQCHQGTALGDLAVAAAACEAARRLGLGDEVAGWLP